jgi:hypothetical protein
MIYDRETGRIRRSLPAKAAIASVWGIAYFVVACVDVTDTWAQHLLRKGLSKERRPEGGGPVEDRDG